MVALMSYKIIASAQSDIGLFRENNEDSWAEDPSIHCFAIADGMGGHRAGEIASREAVSTFCQLMKKSLGDACTLEMRTELMKTTIEQVNSHIYQLGKSDEEMRGMGTTLCTIQFDHDGVVYAHVGDSRIYRLRDKRLEQITTDHSLVRDLIDLGQLSDQQVPEFLYKNIITRAIGTEPYVQPIVKNCEMRDGDIYLMCTDGLTDMLFREEIEAILNLAPTPSDAVSKLVASANARGGYDNITVILMQVKEERAD